MDDFKALESFGLTLPTPAYIFGALIFSIIGFAAYRYGKKSNLGKPKWIGVALMLYPYLVAETSLLYVVGIGLCVGLYLFRN